MTNSPFLNPDQEAAYNQVFDEKPVLTKIGPVGSWKLRGTYGQSSAQHLVKLNGGDRFGDRMKPNHKLALQTYTNSGYRIMNKIMHGEGDYDDETKAMAHHVQEAILTHAKPLNKDIVSAHGIRYRKMTLGLTNMLSNAEPGQRVKMRGYTSTSMSPYIASGFSEPGPYPDETSPEPYLGEKHQHIIVFHHAKGKRTGLYLGDDRSLTTTPREYEFLLPHNSEGTYLGRETHSASIETQPSGFDPHRGPNNEYTHVRSHLHIHHIELDGL